MHNLIRYLNPMEHLGERRYSYTFPLLVNITVVLLSELYVYRIVQDPLRVGTHIIFVNVALILYFSFRDALRGGFISSGFAIAYYFYIIYSRHYSGKQLVSGIETTIILGILFFVLAGIIGWLKQEIDKLIEREADGKRRLESIIQQLPVGVLITDNQGRLVQRNTQVDKILGVQIPIGFTIGKDILSEGNGSDQSFHPSESPLFQSLQSGKPVIGKEFIATHPDGKRVSVQVNAAPIFNSANKVIAAASIITDITRQKALERQKDDFIGIASHELKTPVTSLKVYAQTLEIAFRRKGETSVADKLKRMDVQLDRLTNLISDMLDVTKIQSGKLQFVETSFQFNDLVKEIVEELQLTTSHHKLELKLAESQPVYADRERIGQVITNLLTNAIKYSPGADSVVISSFVREGSVGLSVQDFGVGIPLDKKDRVFEQFFRVGGSEQDTYPGLGLGLYISSEIIKRERGKIWVESEEGRGSTFCFSLPVYKK